MLTSEAIYPPHDKPSIPLADPLPPPQQGGEVFLFAHPGSQIPEGMLLLDACGAEVPSLHLLIPIHTNPTPFDTTYCLLIPIPTSPTPIDTN